MEYVSIADGKPYDGKLPIQVIIPIHKDKPIPHSIAHTVGEGDAEWNDALEYWMFMQGYAHAAKMQGGKSITIPIEVKGGAGSGNWGHVGRPGLVGGSGGRGAVGLVPNNPGLSQGGKNGDKFLSAIMHGADWRNADSTDRELAKRAIIKELAERSGMDEVTVSDIIQSWAGTSNDKDIRALSLQEAAAEELGLNLSEWQLANMSYMQEELHVFNQRVQVSVDEIMETRNIPGHFYNLQRFVDMSNAEVRAFATLHTPGKPMHVESLTSRVNERTVIRTMYDYTQEQLAKAGHSPDGYILLSRGISYAEDPGWTEADVVPYVGNAMESWSASDKVALEFAVEEYRADVAVVVQMAVPVRSIIGTAATGFGCLTEGEYVVAGNIPGNMATIQRVIGSTKGITIEVSGVVS